MRRRASGLGERPSETMWSHLRRRAEAGQRPKRHAKRSIAIEAGQRPKHRDRAPMLSKRSDNELTLVLLCVSDALSFGEGTLASALLHLSLFGHMISRFKANIESSFETRPRGFSDLDKSKLTVFCFENHRLQKHGF